MKRSRKLLLIICGVVLLLVALTCLLMHQQANDDRTPVERRQIADACLAMLHSSLTNEPDDIKPDDLRVPEAIRALHPSHMDVIPNFAVDIYRAEKPEEYFLMRFPRNSTTWILCIAGPSVGSGGGREILRFEHD